jgi:hypothetical protein
MLKYYSPSDFNSVLDKTRQDKTDSNNKYVNIAKDLIKINVYYDCSRIKISFHF